jgi:hypothetical protein
MTECLSLNNLRNDKRALALHFRISEPDAVCYISRKVGGKATPAARTAWEACPLSSLRNRKRLPWEAGFDLLQGVHAKSETFKAKRHLELWLYGHVLEASEPYETVANLIDISQGGAFHNVRFPPNDRGVRRR